MDTFHVFINGFNQTTGQRSVGMFQLFKNACEATKSIDNIRCEIRNYDANMEELASFMLNMAGDSMLIVNVYAYSWGGGRGFISLARALKKRGVEIRLAVLCDPVYSSWFSPLRPVLAFNPWAKITIPSNVNHVNSVHQTQNHPRGHRIVAADRSKTVIHGRVLVNRNHAYIDESTQFRDMVIEGYMTDTRKYTKEGE